MAFRAASQLRVNRDLIFRDWKFYGSTENILASPAAEADANRVRNRHLKAAVLHERRFHRKAIRTLCSVKGMVSPVPGRIPSGVQFMGEISRPARDNLHEVHGSAE